MSDKLLNIEELNESSRDRILKELQNRGSDRFLPKYEDTVKAIIQDVRENGDEALFRYTKQFDRWDIDPSNIRVTEEEIKEATESLDSDFIAVMRESADNIRSFHEKQKKNTWIDVQDNGSILGQRVIPLEITGVYVPGGKAAYPSSVLMNIIPAKTAGVGRIVMCTPAGADGKVNPGTLAAASIAGADEIYKVGGAQAIAAMAYGTSSIPKVCKITGPGNIYVALAKKFCFGDVSIDSVAGPSEILVLCDDSADPGFVAADLLSQAEHDEMAAAVLVTTSKRVAEGVMECIEGFLNKLDRREIIESSLRNYGHIYLSPSLDDAIDAVNAWAPEHLEIQTVDPFETMSRIKNAGAVFLGPWSSEPLGDYWAGPNHILPTGGTARFFSPLSTDDFIKRSSIIYYSEKALKCAHEKIELFAEKEGLSAHANSIRVRFEDTGDDKR
ncbi:MAG: histidinol dehydrogenase [Lachnospiraceae bacterium]|nr:histidinol dehydrogenase [Lachnospiraceae bacterium]